MTAVLDASAVLAVLLGEEGSSRVVGYLDDSQISAVNHAEVLSRLDLLGISVESGSDLVDRLRIEVVPFTASHARAVARLRSLTAGSGLSLGDRACIAVARELGHRVVTADRVWMTLKLGVEVVTIR
ncbi:MAG: type II toxin-antitoxin system VapC family toxin [Acidobacteria bacterium]|nr:type II toxin-antitoxin system VapC family toxin [Acidobacteriota bacterium]MCH8985897.1 type II toxin-antitoxin system VapC family toxin [Acidobacteriota bacterium]